MAQAAVGDFSSGEAVVRFDMSTFRSSGRDWVSLWLSPFEDQIPLPLQGKDCDAGACGANTCHWDNVSISRPVPFTMLEGDRPWVDATTPRRVNYPSPAPANSFLRFMGVGRTLQVSFDGGLSWQNAQPHAVEQATEDHFRPYWMPVPAGMTNVELRGSDWYAGPWMARAPAIWSRTVPLPPPSADCTTRPRTTVQTQPLGDGRLRVKVQAGRAGTPNNIVRKIVIPRAENARVEILGQTIGPEGGSATPASPTQSVTFTVARQVAGATVTVPIIVTDHRGEWSTFVGGGPTAF